MPSQFLDCLDGASASEPKRTHQLSADTHAKRPTVCCKIGFSLSMYWVGGVRMLCLSYPALFCFVFVFRFHPIYPSFFLSLLVVTQVRGCRAGSCPPLPTTVRAFHFYREKISALSSLVDSRRIVLTHARRSQQLILFFIFANIFKISPRRDSNSRTNTTSIRGYH